MKLDCMRMERQQIDSGEYLKKLDSKFSLPEVDQEFLKHVNEPFGKVDLGQEGRIEIKTDRFELTFEQAKASPEQNAKLAKLAASKLPPERDLSQGWMRLSGYSFKTADGKKEFRLDSFVPSHCEVYYFMESDPDERTGFYYLDYFGDPIEKHEAIVLIGDPTSPFGLFTLLHEAGHRVDRARLDRPEITGWESEYAERLYSERTANAFALNKLRPFMRGGTFNEDDVRRSLLLHSLGSHMQGITKDKDSYEYLARHMAKDYDPEADLQEERERYLWDEFDEWQKTDAYAVWKQAPEHRNLETWEEFNLWCDEKGYHH